MTLVFEEDEFNYDVVTISVQELSSSKVVFRNPDGDLYEYVKK